MKNQLISQLIFHNLRYRTTENPKINKLAYKPDYARNEHSLILRIAGQKNPESESKKYREKSRYQIGWISPNPLDFFLIQSSRTTLTKPSIQRGAVSERTAIPKKSRGLGKYSGFPKIQSSRTKHHRCRKSDRVCEVRFGLRNPTSVKSDFTGGENNLK